MTEDPPHRRIYTQVAARIARLIEEGGLQPGSYLPPERILAQQFNVSRSSVREGIIALEVMGAVDVRVGAGVMVTQRPAPERPYRPYGFAAAAEADPELGLEADPGGEVPPFAILEARRLIEPECAALACRRGSDAQLAAIAQAYDRNVADNAQGSRTHPGDRLFHIRIAEASGNAAYHRTMIQLLGQGYGPVFRRLQALYTPDDMPTRSQDEHHSILRALLERRAESARMAMRNHLDNVIEIFSR
jgi:DNA-binding FadR family transcriptional regulator